MQLSTLETALINHTQGDFPLCERPFARLRDRLADKGIETGEAALIDSVRKLLADKTLSRFGPLYDAARLGGGLSLAAMSIPDERYDDIARMVNSYPEVAHNYRREHRLNMWFVLATAQAEQIEQVLQSIENTTRLRVYNFPKQQEFFIGLKLYIDSDGQVSTVAMPANENPQPAADYSVDCYCADSIDRQLVQLTQSGLEPVAEPYRQLADSIGISQKEVLQRLHNMLQHGLIRRIGVVPNHYRLGLKANGMSVWQVPGNKIQQLGERIGQLDFVSHCYQRPPRPPLWPYNLFAMIHARAREQVEARAAEIEALLGEDCLAKDILYSSAVLKKTGMRLAA